MVFVLCILGIIGVLAFQKTAADPKSKRMGMVALPILAAVALFQTITVVPAGHVGVVDIFGKVSNRTLKSGVNIVNPFARVIKFSIKTQEMKEIMEVPSKEGLIVKLEVSVLYHLNPDSAAQVYKTIGPNYEDIIIIPQFRSVVRGVTGTFEAKALYTSARDELAKLIRDRLSENVVDRGVNIETSPLRSIILPPRLTQAIEEKLQAEQESQRMQFVILREKQEAERKKIEAQGIADFQDIVSEGISDKLLRWKGIEATEKLAQSQNTKVIVIGGSDGLPLILDSSSSN